MPEKIAISVKNISKTYRLYNSRSDAIKELLHPQRKEYHKKFHALTDISFEVKKGDIIGIIGQNGSGKSTLLKILASVVTPTSGYFSAKGRVTALLELSGGFNIDLTGVENVYFLGAIQGFTKTEMKERIKEILDFADIGEFAYQPVKTYSSGMHVRLAFSIAINIDPEIIVTDEALAVGDMRFQQKCFRRIREFKDAGKTIVLCTHSTNVVKDLCTRAIWLHQGKIKFEGDPHHAVDAYLAFMNSRGPIDSQKMKAKKATSELAPFIEKGIFDISASDSWINLAGLESFGSGEAHIKYASITHVNNNKSIGNLSGGEHLRVILVVYPTRDVKNAGVQLLLNNKQASTVLKINSTSYKQKILFKANQPNIISIEFVFPMIGNGNYTFSLAAHTWEKKKLNYLHWIHDAFHIKIFNPDPKFKQDSLLVLNDVSIKQLG